MRLLYLLKYLVTLQTDKVIKELARDEDEEKTKQMREEERLRNVRPSNLQFIK